MKRKSRETAAGMSGPEEHDVQSVNPRKRQKVKKDHDRKPKRSTKPSTPDEEQEKGLSNVDSSAKGGAKVVLESSPSGGPEQVAGKKRKRPKQSKDEKPGDGTQPDPKEGKHPDVGDKKSGEEVTGKKPPRFTVFIGNLPFTATKDALYKHFSSLKPIDVRLLTQRDNPSKSRGMAFVDFSGFDHMRTCLEKFHHSVFNDGTSAPRKINVELTAGGGGKKSQRQDKIKQKNAKLNEERVRRAKEHEAAKKEKEMDKQGQAEANEVKTEDDHHGVHPSRRGRVPNHRR